MQQRPARTLPWILACDRRLRCMTICTTRSLKRSSTHTLEHITIVMSSTAAQRVSLSL